MNNLAWGIHKKKLTIIGSRPGHCKSTFSLALAYNLAKNKKKVLFISLEMPPEDIMERLFAYEMLIDNRMLLRGHFPDFQQEWKDFLAKISSMNLMISDLIGKTTAEIQKLLDLLLIKPDLVVIDHLQEIKSGEKDKKKTIDEYLDFLRTMAIRHNFAIIVCSQINRLSQDDKSKEPQLHQLKHSGAIEEKADMVYLLHWPYKYSSQDIHPFQINLAKNRNGPTGYIKLKYYPEIYTFTDYDADGPYKDKPLIVSEVKT